jgi:hypothetical protein
MTEDELVDETIAAREAGDHDRLAELGRLERRGEIEDEPPKYLDREDEGESALSQRAERVLSTAVDPDLRDSLEAVAGAEEPERVLREEIAYYSDGRSEKRADALRELRPSDE